VDELLPVVTSTLSTPEEVADVVERALGDGVALLVPDAEAEPSARYVVELLCKTFPEPIALLGELAGDAVLGYTPMRLAPLGDEQIDALRAIVERHAPQPNSVRGPSGKYPAPGRTGEWKTSRTNPTAPDDDEQEDDDDLSVEVGDPLLSSTIGGKYFIEATLGGGAMGRVYRGRHLALEKPIAIKVLHKRFQRDPQFASRFHREALAASRLDHPNVLRVIDFGNDNGVLYIAMELLSGRDLRTILEEERKLDPKRAVEIMSQVCAGLGAAHDAGIVHRDIKPENIVVTSTRDDEGNVVEQVKVCDFGIAAVSANSDVRKAGVGRRITEEGAICGTPEYMAPEQARGGDVDARAVLYACGVMLYEMVTGQVPFTGPDFMSVLVAHATLEPRAPSTIDPRVDRRIEQVILRALAKNAAVRQQSVRELRAELRAAAEPAPAFPESVRLPAHEAEPPSTRRSGPLAAMPLYAGPLDEPSARFPEFFVAFTAAVARSSYYERGHPEFVRAMSRLTATMTAPLAGRGEITFARLDLPTGSVDLQILTGIGELHELRRVLPQGVASSHGPRLAEVFVRRHVVAITLKEGIDADEMADCVELLCGPELPVDTLRQQFLARGLCNVSLLFAPDLLGRDRRLPWQVDLCISRLARDLRALPLLRGVDTAGLSRLRTQLIGDVLRVLRGADQVRLLLANADLIAASTRHVAELADLDVASAIVNALPQHLAVRLASIVLSELELDAVSGRASSTQGPSARRLIQLLGDRFVTQRTVESDDVLRVFHERAMVNYDELPPDLRNYVRAEAQAGALTKDPDQLLRALDVPSDDEYGRALHTAGLAMRMLARRGEAIALFVLVTRLEQLARGAKDDDRSRAGLARRTLSSLADAEVLAKIADVLLCGAADVRPSARGILLAAGDAGARALVEARERSAEKIGRGRFVEAMRELGARTAPVITSALQRNEEPTVVEDLLRAITDARDDALGTEVTRFLAHAAPPVRRAATAAISGLWQHRAKHALLAGIDDGDEGVRIAAITGLKKIGAVDIDTVRKLGRLLQPGASGSDELRAVAAAALGAAQVAARTEALSILARAIEPRSRSVLAMLSGDAGENDSTILAETIARSLVAIGGDEGRKVVEKRASKSGAELRAKLNAILRR